jgi:putative ABC transport system permease protein
MLRNYLLVAFRSLARQKGIATINVLGLAVGIACVLAISLYVREQLAFDRFHENADRIARLTLETPEQNVVVSPAILAPMLRREMPEVEEAVRVFPVGQNRPRVLRHGERIASEPGFAFADSSIFRVFTLPLVAGDPATALVRPRTLVLSESAAARYFPAGDALGQQLLVDEEPYEVTGVMRDLPAATHLPFDVLASFTTTRWSGEEAWAPANFLTYVLLRDELAMAAFPERLGARIGLAHAAGEFPPSLGFAVEPLRTIHLDVAGNRRFIYLFSAIALLVLLVACVNYMNLATARASQRAREVGVRKATGARRGQLVAQFYGEAFLLSLTGVAGGAGLTAVLLPKIGSLSGIPLALSPGDPLVVSLLVGILLVVTLLAGSYPALVLSSFHPVAALRGSVRSGRGAARFRNALVVFQFAVSVFLLVGTAVVYGQLQYLQSKDLGFRGEQVLALSIGDARTGEALPALKEALRRAPGVESVAAIDRIPGEQRGGYSLLADGLVVPEGDHFSIGGVPAEAGVVETLGLEITAGTDFIQSEAYEAIPGNYVYLVNEATLRATGWTAEEAIGRRISLSSEYRLGTLVGVFRDYHALSLHEEIRPLAIFIEPSQTNELLVRLSPGETAAALAAIEAEWKRLVPHRPFEYRFLDEAFAAAYERDRQTGRLFGGFTLLAVLIACLGLFGLAAFATERRTREIGIRRVMGAGTGGIVLLLTREFSLLVIAGALVATPAAYYVASRWLDDFAYRITLGPGLFLAAGAVALAIALVTVSFQSVRAALADPVKSLRAE